MVVKEDRLYTESDEWIKVEGNRARIGITDYAQEKMNDLTYVELPAVDTVVKKGDPVAVVESVKSAEDIYSPLSGKIVAVNQELEDTPEKINEDPYGEGWIYEIEISDPSELEGYMDHTAYESYLSDRE